MRRLGQVMSYKTSKSHFAAYLEFGDGLMVVAPEVGRKIIAIKPVSKTFIEQLQLNNHYLQEFSILTFAQKPRVA